MGVSSTATSQEEKATAGAPSSPVFLHWPLYECIHRLGESPPAASLASPFTHWPAQRLRSGSRATANKQGRSAQQGDCGTGHVELGSVVISPASWFS